MKRLLPYVVAWLWAVAAVASPIEGELESVGGVVGVASSRFAVSPTRMAGPEVAWRSFSSDRRLELRYLVGQADYGGATRIEHHLDLAVLTPGRGWEAGAGMRAAIWDAPGAETGPTLLARGAIGGGEKAAGLYIHLSLMPWDLAGGNDGHLSADVGVSYQRGVWRFRLGYLRKTYFDRAGDGDESGPFLTVVRRLSP